MAGAIALYCFGASSVGGHASQNGPYDPHQLIFDRFFSAAGIIAHQFVGVVISREQVGGFPRDELSMVGENRVQPFLVG